MDRAWRTYLIVSAADWLLLGLVIVAAIRWLNVPAWPGLLLLAAWIVKDLLLYPSARRYYESEPAHRRMVGEEGEALCQLDPDGFARVHGEIWQVRVEAGAAPLPAGARLRVRDVDGMRLLVDPVTPG